MKIYLHIGAPRTGTSSLQALLHANRSALLDHNIDYVKIGYVDERDGDAQHNLAFSLMDEYPAFVPPTSRVRAETVWDELAGYLKRTNKDIFLSSEAFSSLSVTAIRYIQSRLEGHEIDVLYAARDARSWHRSMALQQIKDFPFRTEIPSTFQGDPRSITNQHLAAWIEAGVTPTVFEYGPDIVDKVLGHIGVPLTALTATPSRNASMPSEVLELLMSLNQISMSDDQHARINRLVESWFREIRDDAPDASDISDVLRLDTFNDPARYNALFERNGLRRTLSTIRQKLRRPGADRHLQDLYSTGTPSNIVWLLKRLYHTEIPDPVLASAERVILSWQKKVANQVH